jgi:phosphatidylglycerophosphate synthase
VIKERKSGRKDSVVTFLIQAQRPFNFAHLLTSSRIILTPVFLFAVEAGLQQSSVFHTGLVTGLFCIICASDYYDGPLARALGLNSDFGRMLDNLADITFLLVTLSYLVYREIVPWWIPATISVAFSQYLIDSWILSRRGPLVVLVANPIGHWAGILNYIFTGVMAVHAASQQQFPPPLLCHIVLIFWESYLLFAIGMRLRFFLQSWQAVAKSTA